MSSVLQRMAVLQAVPDAAADDSDPEAADIAQLAALMPADETQLLYSICLHGRADLGLAPDEYAALTMVLLRLLAFKPTAAVSVEKKTLKVAPQPALEPPLRAVSAPAPVVSPTLGVAPEFKENGPTAPVKQALTATSSVANDIAHVGQHLPVRGMSVHASQAQVSPQKFETIRPVAQVQPARVATNIEAVQVREQPELRRDQPTESAAAAVQPSAEGDFWYATVQALVASEAINAMVRELALQAQLVARDDDQWLLRVERESLNQPGSRDRLANALAGAGHPVRLVAEIGRVTDSPAKRNAAAAAERQLAAEKIVFDDPLVQALMRDFGAKIVPGSIKPG
jgi:DNA polymerase-3 subunit gamma/tau